MCCQILLPGWWCRVTVLTSVTLRVWPWKGIYWPHSQIRYHSWHLKYKAASSGIWDFYTGYMFGRSRSFQIEFYWGFVFSVAEVRCCKSHHLHWLHGRNLSRQQAHRTVEFQGYRRWLQRMCCEVGDASGSLLLTLLRKPVCSDAAVRGEQQEFPSSSRQLVVRTRRWDLQEVGSWAAVTAGGEAPNPDLTERRRRNRAVMGRLLLARNREHERGWFPPRDWVWLVDSCSVGACTSYAAAWGSQVPRGRFHSHQWSQPSIPHSRRHTDRQTPFSIKNGESCPCPWAVVPGRVNDPASQGEAASV